MIGFQTNIQSTLGQGLYNSMTGKFDSIFDAWKDLLFRMVSAGLASHVTESVFGADGKSGLLKGGISILESLLGGFGSMGTSVGGTKLGSSNFGQFLWPAAKGAYFDGNVAKFALGGIVDSPTPFKFASGASFQNGLMGEAGPEAIMPLKRDSSGRLGVSGGAGRSVVITQNINIDSRADRTEVHAIVSRAVKNGNAELVDLLERNGRI